MIPKICANCGCAANIADGEGNIALSNCHKLPITISKRPDDFCFSFQIAENPPIYVNPGQVEGGTANGTLDGESSALGGIFEEDMGRLGELVGGNGGGDGV